MDGIKYGECPDVILFHRNGRYIVFNDAEGGKHYWLPITEKGNWEIKNESIVLRKDVNKHQYNDSITNGPMVLTIKHISREKLILVGINKSGEKYTKTYKRGIFTANQMQCYNGYGTSIAKLFLSPQGGVTLLKLRYNLLSPNNTKSSPSILTIRNQDGHELWHKTIILEQEKKSEEILLADMPEAIELAQIIFEIHTNVGWVL